MSVYIHIVAVKTDGAFPFAVNAYYKVIFAVIAALFIKLRQKCYEVSFILGVVVAEKYLV